MSQPGSTDPFAVLAEALGPAVLLLRHDRVEYANSSACRLFQRQADELLGMHRSELLDQAPSAAEPGAAVEFYARPLTPQGPGAMSSGCLYNLGDSQELAVLKPSDSLADLGAMTAGLLHNLAAPLSVIRSTAELVGSFIEQASKDDPLLAQRMQSWPPSVLQGRQAIIERVDRIIEAARDLLAKLRGEAHQQRESLDLNHILASEVELLNNDLAFKHQVTTEMDLDPQLPPVRGLYSDFSHSFRNLLTNAAQAMADSEEKHLYVSSRYDPESRTIAVMIVDSGHGIAQEHMDRIFDPFFTTGPKGRATGLGLHSVRQLLLPYGARFQVQSRPGRTAFTVEIPLPGERRA